MLVVDHDELYILTMPLTTFYAFSARDSALYIFVGFSASDVTSRCQSIGNGVGYPTSLPDNKVHRLWKEDPKGVHVFFTIEASSTLLHSLLPKEKHYGRISHFTFTPVESPYSPQFAEQWMSDFKRAVLTLSQRIQCDLWVQNAQHLIHISPLGKSTVDVDVKCSSTDTEAMSRVATLTKGNKIKLTINTLSIEHLRSLQEACVMSLSVPYNSCPNTLPTILTLQHLHTLTLFSSPNLVPLQTLPQPLYSALPSLRELNLNMSPDHGIRILRGICTTTLQSLTLDFPSLGRDSLRDLANLLSQRCARSLMKLHIRAHALHRSEDATWCNILAFQILGNLHDFSFEHPLPLNLSAKHVKALLQAWPHAVSISLNPRAPISPNSMLSSMEVLVVVCREASAALKHFGITIDPRTASQAGASGSAIRSRCQLEYLDIGTWKIERTHNELNVLPFLSTIFPSLRHIKRGTDV